MHAGQNVDVTRPTWTELLVSSASYHHSTLHSRRQIMSHYWRRRILNCWMTSSLNFMKCWRRLMLTPHSCVLMCLHSAPHFKLVSLLCVTSSLCVCFVTCQLLCVVCEWILLTVEIRHKARDASPFIASCFDTEVGTWLSRCGVMCYSPLWACYDPYLFSYHHSRREVHRYVWYSPWQAPCGSVCLSVCICCP